MPFPNYSPLGPFAVEINVQNGVVYHGKLIDICDDNALVETDVNWTGTNQLFSCTTVFQCDDRDQLHTEYRPRESYFDPPARIFVLLQLEENAAWIWYPDELLAVYLCAFGVVRVEMQRVQQTLVVPRHHIRCTNYPRIPFQGGDNFVKLSYTIPEAWGQSFSREILQKFNEVGGYHDHGIAAKEIVDGELVCIATASWMAQIKKDLLKTDEFVNDLVAFGKRKHSTEAIARQPDEKVKKTDNVQLNNVMNTLPNELLSRIFAFLDLYEQIRIRRVCCLWNSLLPLCATFRPKSIWIRIDEPRHPKDTDYVRKVAICLNKCWSSRMETLILSFTLTVEYKMDLFYMVAGALETMSTVLQQPLFKRVVLFDLTLYNDSFSGCFHNVFIKSARVLSASCDTVVFDRIPVRLFPDDYYVDNDVLDKWVLELKGQLDLTQNHREYEGKFYDLLESQIPDFSQEEVQHVQLMVQRYFLKKRAVLHSGMNFVETVIWEYQHDDPRPGAFEVDIADRELPEFVPRFNRLTLFVLQSLSFLFDADL
ncbi:uncharacterized protein LOC129586047 [Paramacrobiotus metropolitanus]|uniref:uncharacterized protein LOC129586047 n=1 Tax=Paramacrobiotus metropolitanus TaxID=2943436 RepID=UPI00244640AA|nr:uncharacterized protein LOC129586047 [Paramacrobiotus metropolitanus]